MDRILEDRWAPIARQWSEDGEAVFRRREAELVQQLADDGRSKIVSTGGGAVLSQTSVEAMRASGTVIWLRATPETMRQRLSGGPQRPPLATRAVEELEEERREIYRASADVIIDTDTLAVDQVVEEVVTTWK